MSHVPGLQSRREAPPLLGPLRSPSPLLPAPPDAAQQPPIPHHRFGWVRGPGAAQPSHRCRAETPRPGVPIWAGSSMCGGVLGPRWGVWQGCLSQGSAARRRGWGAPGVVRGRSGGRGAGGGPSPRISGDRVTEPAEGGGGVGRGALRRRTEPPAPAPAALGLRLAVPARPDPRR